MDNRIQNEDLPIVFGTAVTAVAAEKKLKDARVGSFLIRESSIDGLISVTHKIQNPKTKVTEIKHYRFAITPGEDGRLMWKGASANAIEAKAFAEKVKNAFTHIKEQPDSLQSLIKLLQDRGVDVKKIVKPENKQESSNNYNGYSANSYHSSVNMFLPDQPKKHTGYGSE
ncbi:MAG TPA: SH2 domain-containing protein [Gammaproteobacteria bacterium]|jgi:hypothetical protein|nr:SH2 domain-containing protein [Gammaproteobacteria bacterium]